MAEFDTYASKSAERLVMNCEIIFACVEMWLSLL